MGGGEAREEASVILVAFGEKRKGNGRGKVDSQVIDRVMVKK